MRLSGRPIGESNFGSSIGRRGLSAPAQDISSLGTNGEPRSFHGTSAAAPFVTGTIALLLSEFPSATDTDVKLALLQGWRAEAASSRLCWTPPPHIRGWPLSTEGECGKEEAQG